MTVDLPTLYLALIVVDATLALTIALSISRRENEGSGYWAAAFALNGGFCALTLLTGRLNPLITVVTAQVLLSAGFALILEGLFEFQLRRPPKLSTWAPVGVIGAAFLLTLNNAPLRTGIGSLVIAFQCLQVILTLNEGRRETAGAGQHLVAVGMALTALSPGLRIIWSVSDSLGHTSLRTLVRVDVAAGINGIVCLILISHGLLVMIKDRTDLRIRTLAIQDPLTGLANRRRMEEILASEWSRARRSQRPLALIMLDVDSFKKFNDTYGHPAGDACLKAIADVLASVTRRAGDLAARYGGEEFLLILPGVGRAAARDLAETIRAAIEALRTPHALSIHGVVTASVGVSVMDQGSHADMAALLRDADAALYRAKERGGNQVRTAPTAAAPFLPAAPPILSGEGQAETRGIT